MDGDESETNFSRLENGIHMPKQGLLIFDSANGIGERTNVGSLGAQSIVNDHVLSSLQENHELIIDEILPTEVRVKNIYKKNVRCNSSSS